MKKIFTLLSLALVAFMAQATRVSVHVDDVSHIQKFVVNGEEKTFNADGYYYDETFEGESLDCYLYTAAPYVIDDENSYYMDEYPTGDVYKCSVISYYSDHYNIWVGDYSRQIDYEIVTVDDAVVRKNTATFKIHGNPEKVSLYNNYTYNQIDFTEEETTFRFMDQEANPTLQANDSSNPLYKVEVNGDELTERNWNKNYDLQLNNGDIIDVYTEWPEKDITVTLVFKGEAGRKSICGLQLGGKDLLDPSNPIDLTQPIVGKMGQTFQMTLTGTNYTTNQFSINGVDQEIVSYGNSYSDILTEDLTFVIDQTKKPCYTATVTVDDYTRIKYDEAYVYDLVPTSNTFVIEVAQESASWCSVSISPIDYTVNIDKCTFDGVELEKNYYGDYSMNLSEGTHEVNVETSVIERNDMFSFYFNSPEKIAQYNVGGWNFSCSGSMARNESLYKSIKPGYNYIDFGAADGDFSFFTYGGEDVINFYKNNEKVEGQTGWGVTWTFTPTDGDSYKVYVTNEEPSFYTATFAVEDEAAVLGAYVDGIKEIEVGDKAEFNELQETGFSLLIAEGYIVKLNGEEIDPMEEPVENVSRGVESKVYYFDLVKDTDVRIVKEESGIDSISVEENVANPAVYNMLGVKVSNGTTDNLPSGFYVQKGRKIYVK